MYKLVFLLLAMLFSFNIAAQNVDASTVSELLSKYQANNEVADLESAKKLIDKATIESPNNMELWSLKAAICTEMAKLTDSDLSEGAIVEGIEAYEKTLETDKDGKARNTTLRKLYDLKLLANAEAVEHYKEQDYESAYDSYQKAYDLNKLELEYPMIPRIDTATIYSLWINAKLANNGAVAREHLEDLINLEYNRPELYDEMIKLYRADGAEQKAIVMEEKKKRLFGND